jgi:transcription initiation factor TFIIB
MFFFILVMMEENDDEQFLNMSEEDIDNLLLGINVCDTDKKNINRCTSCQGDNLVTDESQGCDVCMDCGVINMMYLNKNPTFNKDGDDNKMNASYGCPTNYFFPKSALGTKIKCKGYNRISALQRQGQMPYKEKSLMEELFKIQDKCKQYNITQSIIDTAKILYKKVNDSKHTKGTRKGKSRIMRCINRKSMIAACVFYACKLQGEPRSPKEIADIYSLEIKHVNKGYRKFMDYIDINELQQHNASSKSTDFIKRFASKLDMDERYILIATEISANINKLDLASTHEPPSVAAGCLLLVVNMYSLNINKKQISDVFGISDVTISKTYRRIAPFHKIITSNEITDMILEKKQNQPKVKSNITKENLILLKRPDNNVDTETDTETSVNVKPKRKSKKVDIEPDIVLTQVPKVVKSQKIPKVIKVSKKANKNIAIDI